MTEIIYDDARLENGEILAADIALARFFAETLESHYPGWKWAVEANHAQGIVTVRSWVLHHTFGFNIRMAEYDTPTRQRAIAIEAGGSLLELFGAPRGPFRQELMAELRKPEDAIAAALPRMKAQIEARKKAQAEEQMRPMTYA